MRLLVTGGLGFIGSHLCAALLREGHTVAAFDNTVDAAALAAQTPLMCTYPRTYSYIPGTIRDPISLQAAFLRVEPEVVIHLAALPGVRSSISDPMARVHINIGGTTHVLEACKTHGVSRLLFASSSSVYGHSEQPQRASRETDACDHPLSPYAWSKRASELLCQTYCSLHGMTITALRFFSVYGPRQRPDLVLPTFARQMLAGEPLTIFGDGQSLRDYTYIDDIVDGICRALYQACEDPELGAYWCYNLGSGTPIALHTLIALLQEALGVAEVQRTYLPGHPADPLSTWADIYRAQRELGYTPAVGFPEGVQRFATWFRTTC